MNLLIDESVDRQIVEKLRQEGHDIVYVSDLDPGISDDKVLSTANSMRALRVSRGLTVMMSRGTRAITSRKRTPNMQEGEVVTLG